MAFIPDDEEGGGVHPLSKCGDNLGTRYPGHDYIKTFNVMKLLIYLDRGYYEIVMIDGKRTSHALPPDEANIV